ncbi:FHA domain-containing protein [Quadrisphaera oryzae]|nr:hypothetical protein [Quadrisphaera sp. RL12-1S]
MSAARAEGAVAVVDFCGEEHVVPSGGSLWIGRDADLSVDDNPYLHRRFLLLRHEDGAWWLSNEGSLLSATVHDDAGLVRSSLASGARLALPPGTTKVLFTAGSTTYELAVRVPGRLATRAAELAAEVLPGEATVGPVVLTESQRLLVLALCEPALRRSGAVGAVLPSNAQAAARLGWSLTRFNRKLDNVCDRLDRSGVTGLRGGPGKLASGRRARLVEHAVASRLVGEEDLPLLAAARRAAAASATATTTATGPSTEGGAS